MAAGMLLSAKEMGFACKGVSLGALFSSVSTSGAVLYAVMVLALGRVDCSSGCAWHRLEAGISAALTCKDAVP